MPRPLRLRLERLENRNLLSTYYVAPTGNDAAAGSSSAPWATLQHAADVVRAGDIVNVSAGNYAGFMIQAGGTAASPITFKANGAVNITSRNSRTPDGINI